MNIYFLTFVVLILIFSTSIWRWMTRTNAPVLRKMVAEDVEQELDERQELSEDTLADKDKDKNMELK